MIAATCVFMFICDVEDIVKSEACHVAYCVEVELENTGFAFCC